MPRKAMTIKHRREQGEALHSTPRHTLCKACWKVIDTGLAYCSPEHEAAHLRLAR